MKHSSVLGVIALFAFACTGPMGPRGETGPAGMTGAQGPAGMTGSQGEAGMTASPRTSAAGWISLRDILFDSGSAEIRPSEVTKISDVSAYVNQNRSIRVGIAGSSDLVRGTDRYDVDLSQRRVDNVRDALIRSGVSASRIETGAGVERVECNDSREQCPRREGRVEVMGRNN